MTARVAVLYDIHGNLPALEAVLDEVREAGVDAIVIGGDVVPGPLPRETLAHLRSLVPPVRCLRGNGEREVLASRRGEPSTSLPESVQNVLRWTAAELDRDEVRWLESWPATLRVAIDGLGAALFCHATPRNDTEIFTRRTAEDRLAPVFAGVDAPLVVCGHTHMQFDRSVGPVRVVNAGSVGMPLSGPGAHWLLLGPGVELRRTTYDAAAAAVRIRASRYPEAAAFAEQNVLHPPSEEETLDRFAAVELS
jgi:predicted phosphodiesterase